ncbi:type II toxin-antitoxin system RelE/ParE family toxin [Flagellimonas myxillae]|uniref:type II toxin-antitoxin system RelE/ParE family toxin n=1 Tax=Flagellimonas myxillae TaxID=2942214 RepID=UPI00201EFECF|nr:type II toxin-antitoxin system RelE/ParE family toxin [Muricauda myxillae]MCL6267657.1 type II toxin-antitoxin system RelE/ParE family toxin [Muricauda myxillae]
MPKRTPEFRLTKAAESDIASIAGYTIYKFGIGQARKYRNGLIETFTLLARNPTLGITFFLGDELVLKRFRFEAHVIFYKQTATGILVVRVLGGMMDFKRHL